MSTVLFRLGRGCARHPFKTIAVWFVAVLAVFAASSRLGAGLVDNFVVPGVESQHGTDVLKEKFPAFAGAAARIVFHTDRGRIDDAPRRAIVTRTVGELRRVPDVSLVSDPFERAAPAVSADGHTAYTTVQFSEQTLQRRHYQAAAAAIGGARRAGLQTEISGQLAAAGKEVKGNEAIGVGVAIVVLLIAFGSVIAMGLPIVTAVLGVAVGMAGVGLYAAVESVPTVTRMLAIMIGLGVGIDYALFMVTRHREHLHDGMDPRDAAGQATATAGQSVLFAGTTVVIAICGLLLAGIPAVTAMGFAIGITVIASMLIAITLLPGLLGLAGHRIDRLAIHRRKLIEPSRRTLSASWAHHVGRRPWRYAAASLAVLVAGAAPVLSMRLGFTDDSNEPADSTARKSYELLAHNFGPGLTGTLNAVIELPSGDTTTAPAVATRCAAPTASPPSPARSSATPATPPSSASSPPPHHKTKRPPSSSTGSAPTCSPTSPPAPMPPPMSSARPRSWRTSRAASPTACPSSWPP